MDRDASPTTSGRVRTPRRRPGRPACGTSPLDRDQLLAVAARAFSTGYASTSVRAIARELGVSQAAVQHHASTKDALLRAVIDGFMVPRLAAARTQLDALGPDEDPAESLRRMIRTRIGALAEHGGLVVAILADTSPDTSPGASPGADSRREHLLDRLLPATQAGMQSLRTLVQRGAVRPPTVVRGVPRRLQQPAGRGTAATLSSRAGDARPTAGPTSPSSASPTAA